VVGNGTSSENRKNALEVWKTGQLFLGADATAGGHAVRYGQMLSKFEKEVTPKLDKAPYSTTTLTKENKKQWYTVAISNQASGMPATNLFRIRCTVQGGKWSHIMFIASRAFG
jgi:hypothetical protein